MSKVIQEPPKSPFGFHCEVYQVFTSIGPDAPENKQASNTALVVESTPDIRKKLQRLEGFERMNTSQLPEIAQNIFSNHDCRRNAEQKIHPSSSNAAQGNQ